MNCRQCSVRLRERLSILNISHSIFLEGGDCVVNILKFPMGVRMKASISRLRFGVTRAVCLVGVAALVSGACSARRSDKKTPEHKDVQDLVKSCAGAQSVTLCLAGAFKRTDGANPYFRALCEKLPGLIKDCSGRECQSLFLFADSEGAGKALFSRLDTNKDGVINGKDECLAVSIVGYSWGGVTATTLAHSFLNDPKVAVSHRRVENLITVDPYSPVAGGKIAIPSGVVKHWSYRHSKAAISRGHPYQARVWWNSRMEISRSSSKRLGTMGPHTWCSLPRNS